MKPPFPKTSIAVGLVAVIALLGLAAGCGSTDPGTGPDGSGGSGGSSGTLTLYNAQHESLTTAMVAGFTKQTGIKVDIRNGKDFELANQIVQEGDASPADVFMTENSPGMQVVASRGLFAPVDPATLAQVPARWSPSTGDWIGVAARSTVLVYNPDKIAAAALPNTIMDLSAAEWHDRIGIAATGADFQAIVSAVVAVEGIDAAKLWLEELEQNAKQYQGNGAVLKAVNDGEVSAGIIYHYYWYKDRAEAGTNSSHTELHYFAAQDAGAFVSVSGAGVLKSSKHAQDAQALVAYLTGKDGQQILADSDALEYTLGSAVPANAKLKPFADLQPPDVDVADLNGPEVIELMQGVGLL